MSNVHELCRGHQPLKRLIRYALKEGWTVIRAHGGHLKLIKPGLPPIYSGSPISDCRGGCNVRPTHKPASRKTAGVDPNKNGGRYD